ncbi:MAG: NAD-dependent epimerase/dehydratase family protein [Clostridiales bacterium]|nr:NAD-dependent epimerase/dehydratase family protein [Clostridiales bacterium]
MKALVVGGAGFVGGYLIEHLIRDCGYNVLATKLENEKIENSESEVCNLDIMDSASINQLLNRYKPDCIFHLAAQSSVALSWRNPQLTVDINIKGTLNLLDGIKDMDSKTRLLLIGSGEEYGLAVKGSAPVGEENSTKPGNIYAVTKATQNMLGGVYSKAFGMDIVMVRAFNHMGPRQSEMFVVSDFCKQVAEIETGKKENILMVGNLSAKRDFTDVRDVVRAYGLLAQGGKTGETYNVGSGQAIAIQKILDMILSMANVDICVETDEKRLRPSEIPTISADILKIKNEVGWVAEIPIERTIEDTLNYWRDRVRGVGNAD